MSRKSGNNCKHNLRLSVFIVASLLIVSGLWILASQDRGINEIKAPTMRLEQDLVSTSSERDIYNSFSDILGFSVYGDLIYMALEEDGIAVINSSDYSDYNTIQAFETSDARDVIVEDEIAYICDGVEGIELVNISNPMIYESISTCDTPGISLDICIEGDYAYVADDYAGLQILNTTNSSDPNILGSCQLPDSAYEVCINESYAIVAAGEAGIQVIDISAPTNPTICNQYDIPGSVRDIYLNDSICYLAVDNYGLIILNMTELPNITTLGRIKTEKANCIDIVDDLAYVTGEYSIQNIPQDTLNIFNVSDPTNPSLLAYCSLSVDYTKCYQITVADQNAYISHKDWTLSGLQIFEIENGSMNYAFDPDEDKLSTLFELYDSNSDPLRSDTDFDGINDYDEFYIYSTNPRSGDSDVDDMSDLWEIAYALDPLNATDNSTDLDGDGLLNADEYLAGTSPVVSDCDEDGLNDGIEYLQYGTNPLDNDTDGDLIGDGYETKYALNPHQDDAILDPDEDGLSNLQEYYLGTAPKQKDSDGDGFSDGAEVNLHGTNPLDYASAPDTVDWIMISIVSIIILIVTVVTVIILKKQGLILGKGDINVFISHAVDDFETYQIKRLGELQETKEINKVFYCEEDLRFNIEEWMDETVPLSHFFIFIATENSMSSGPCKREIRLASKHNLLKIPIRDHQIPDTSIRELIVNPVFETDPIEPKSNKIDDIIHALKEYFSDLSEKYKPVYKILKKNKSTYLDAIIAKENIQKRELLFSIRLLLLFGKIKGALSDDGSLFLRDDEIIRRYKGYNLESMNLTMDEKLEKMQIAPVCRRQVEELIKSE